MRKRKVSQADEPGHGYVVVEYATTPQFFIFVVCFYAIRIRYPSSELCVVVWNKCMPRGCTQK